MWTASSEFGTYRLCEQRRFRRACASAQSRQNLRCSLIQAVSQEEPSDRKSDPWPLWMAGHAQLKFVMTECSKTQIRLTGLMCRPTKLHYLRVNPMHCRVVCVRFLSWFLRRIYLLMANYDGGWVVSVSQRKCSSKVPLTNDLTGEKDGQSQYVNWATSRGNLSSGVYDQVKHKSACSSTETS